jgi:hypothetical protein
MRGPAGEEEAHLSRDGPAGTAFSEPFGELGLDDLRRVLPFFSVVALLVFLVGLISCLSDLPAREDLPHKGSPEATLEPRIERSRAL